MADTHDTIDGLLAEMRDEAARADMEQGYSLDDAAEMMREFAWRFEAAHKRERGDCAKLREAIAKCVNLITEFGNAEIVKTSLDVIIDIEAILKAALAAPPRNCDVYNSESCRLAYHLHGDGLMTMQAFADWLFAPATEQKGENK